jgi:ABC-type transport system involved in multi-copper enzyme maturation permease subunit
MYCFLRSSAILYANQLRRIVRSKRALVCLALALVPMGLAFFVVWVAQRHGGNPPAVEIGWVIQVQVIMPILALIIGSAVVSEEVEDRTVTYIFSRPIRRYALLWGRWLAAATFLCAVLAAGTYGTFAILDWGLSGNPRSELPKNILGPLMCVVLLGGLVYSALFAVLGTVFKHPMIIGLGYVFAIEGFLSNMPGKMQVLTIQYYLRSIIAASGSESWRDLEVFSNSMFEPGSEALTTLAILLGGALLLGSWILSRRQYVLPA